MFPMFIFTVGDNLYFLIGCRNVHETSTTNDQRLLLGFKSS